MKKSKLLTIFGMLACSAFLIGCGAGNNGGSSFSPDTSDKTENGAYDNYLGDWELSGKIADFYFLKADGSNGVTKEFTDVQGEVSVGSLVNVVAPVVIDGKGNVLDVSYGVKVKGGAEVAVEAGAFFAMDGRGYEIIYIVNTLDGKTHEFIKTVTVSGADDLYVSKDLIVELLGMSSVLPVELIDLNGATQYNLTDLMSVEAKDLYDRNAAKGDVSWRLIPSFGEEIISSSANVKLGDEDNQVAKASYIAVAQTVENGVITPFYVKPVDFYDLKTDGFVWNTRLTEASSASLYNTTDNTSLEVVNGAKGASGSFFKVSMGLKGNAETFDFMLNPMHSAAYYEMFEVSDYTLSYDFYFEGTGLTAEKSGEPIDAALQGVFGTINGSYNGGAPYYSRRQFYSDKWNNVSLVLNDYGEKWSSMATFESLYFAPGYACYIDNGTAYFGNFKLIEGNTRQGDLELIDVKGKSTYDLKNVMTESGKATIAEAEKAGKTLRYALYPGYSSITGDQPLYTSSSSSLNVRALDLRYYTFKVAEMYGDFAKTLYIGAVDFYNSLLPFEWNKMNVNNVALKNSTGTAAAPATEIGVVNEAQGKSGEYFKITSGKDGATTLAEANQAYNFTFLPAHSKGYYERYQGEGVTLTFDTYLEVATTDVVCSQADGDKSAYGKAFTATATSTFWGLNGKIEGYNASTYRTGTSLNKWQKVTLKLDEDMLDLWNWDNLGNGYTDGPKDRMITTETLFLCQNVSGNDYDETVSKVSYVTPEVATLYIGNFVLSQPESSEAITLGSLVDVDGKTQYDLLDAFSTANKENLQEFAENGDLSWTLDAVFGAERYELTDNSVLNLQTVKKQYYNVTLTWNYGDGEMTLVEGWIDLYDINDGFVWNTMDMANVSLKAENGTAATARTSVEKVTSAKDKTGEYFKITSGSLTATSNTEGTEAYNFTVLPSHSHAYYTLPAWEGYKLQFEAYIEASAKSFVTSTDTSVVENGALCDVTFNAGSLAVWGYPKDATATYRNQVYMNKWVTVTMDLSYLLNGPWSEANWKSLGTGNLDNKLKFFTTEVGASTASWNTPTTVTYNGVDVKEATKWYVPQQTVTYIGQVTGVGTNA